VQTGPLSFIVSYTRVLGNNSVGKNFVLEIKSASQQKPERRKVQAQKLYGFPVLHLSPIDALEATEDLTDRSW